jgi:hypothetical protein
VIFKEQEASGLLLYRTSRRRLHPNPFVHTLCLFTLFGVGSACLKAFIWPDLCGGGRNPVSSGKALRAAR